MKPRYVTSKHSKPRAPTFVCDFTISQKLWTAGFSTCLADFLAATDVFTVMDLVLREAPQRFK